MAIKNLHLDNFFCAFVSEMHHGVLCSEITILIHGTLNFQNGSEQKKLHYESKDWFSLQRVRFVGMFIN